MANVEVLGVCQELIVLNTPGSLMGDFVIELLESNLEPITIITGII